MDDVTFSRMLEKYKNACDKGRKTWINTICLEDEIAKEIEARRNIDQKGLVELISPYQEICFGVYCEGKSLIGKGINMEEKEIRQIVGDFSKDQLVDLVVELSKDSNFCDWQIREFKDKLIKAKSDSYLQRLGQVTNDTIAANEKLSGFEKTLREKYGEKVTYGQLTPEEIRNLSNLECDAQKKNNDYQKFMKVEKDPYEEESK